VDLAPSIVIDRRRMSKERLPAIPSGSIRTKGQVVRSRDRFSAFECKGEGVSPARDLLVAETSGPMEMRAILARIVHLETWKDGRDR